jgi:hypothetical protein
MSELFDPNKNPLSFILQQYVFHFDQDIKNKKVKNNINNNFIEYISYQLNNQDDVKYLDYKIKADKTNSLIEIKAGNIVTALWFINIFPSNIEKILMDNEYILPKGKYKFNKRTKKLRWIKNK